MQEEFWNAKYCNQLNNIIEEIKTNLEAASFSIDDTFELASRITLVLDRKEQTPYEQVQSVMFKGKKLIKLRFTPNGSEHERRDIAE